MRTDHISATWEDDKECKIRNEDELHNWIIAERPADSVMCSSSMDHPEEYTDNQELIDLANLIRA